MKQDATMTPEGEVKRGDHRACSPKRLIEKMLDVELSDSAYYKVWIDERHLVHMVWREYE